MGRLIIQLLYKWELPVTNGKMIGYQQWKAHQAMVRGSVAQAVAKGNPPTIPWYPNQAIWHGSVVLLYQCEANQLFCMFSMDWSHPTESNALADYNALAPMGSSRRIAAPPKVTAFQEGLFEWEVGLVDGREHAKLMVTNQSNKEGPAHLH